MSASASSTSGLSASRDQLLDEHRDVGTRAEARADGDDVLLELENRLERAGGHRAFRGLVERHGHVLRAHRGDDWLRAPRRRDG